MDKYSEPVEIEIGIKAAIRPKCPPCPKCKSENIRISGWVVLVQLAPDGSHRHRRFQCKTCRHVYWIKAIEMKRSPRLENLSLENFVISVLQKRYSGD